MLGGMIEPVERANRPDPPRLARVGSAAPFPPIIEFFFSKIRIPAQEDRRNKEISVFRARPSAKSRSGRLPKRRLNWKGCAGSRLARVPDEAARLSRSSPRHSYRSLRGVAQPIA
jgi:hypothetical protein